MSRSYGKKMRLCGKSDKVGKKFAHHSQRAMERQVLTKIRQDYDSELDEHIELEFKDERVTSDVYGFSSDGTTGMYLSKEDLKYFFDNVHADLKKGLIRK